jgi:hypothetical protein
MKTMLGKTINPPRQLNAAVRNILQQNRRKGVAPA